MGLVKSQLIVEGTHANNMTTVKCNTFSQEGFSFPGSSGVLRVFGKSFNLKLSLYCVSPGLPGPPRDLKASSQRGHIILSWSSPFLVYSIPVNFQVEVKESDSGIVLATIDTNLTSFNYIPQVGLCSILRFEMLTTNEAGESNRSFLEYSMLTSMRTIIVMLL